MGTALAMYISFLFMATWLSPTVRQRVVGMGLFADIGAHVVLQSMFGGDAEGRAGLLLAGVLINATMHAYRAWCGYQTLTLRGWVMHPPRRMATPPRDVTDIRAARHARAEQRRRLRNQA